MTARSPCGRPSACFHFPGYSLKLDTIVLMCNISRRFAPASFEPACDPGFIAEPSTLQAFAAMYSARLTSDLAAAHRLIYDIVRKPRVAEHLDGSRSIA